MTSISSLLNLIMNWVTHSANWGNKTPENEMRIYFKWIETSGELT